ncbi:AraC family transcriptional regulator [Paenibacillus sp.]|uniref:AraC family transcriptional regulator n=1 Tax=Paenibacillus sp. TaxID=58172 RepID=UPI00281141F7|nr:AraC family transcriptional regulator [Paenibacillus sp.]
MRISPIYQEAPHHLRRIDEDFHISLTQNEVIRTPLHHHEFVELAFVTDGDGVETVNGISHRLRQGTATFLLPHHIHQIHSTSIAPIRKYCCMFNLDLFSRAAEDAELFAMLLQVGTTISSWADIGPEQINRIRMLFEHMKEELQGPAAIGQPLLIRAKLTEALLLFMRAACGDGRQIQERISAADRNDRLIQTTFWTILGYIRVHYHEPFTLRQLAERFHMSASHLSRSFKRHLGYSFMDYVHLLRTNNAASLLSATTMSVTDIAVSVGFDSLRTFSRVFREIYGQTPSEYRKASHIKPVEGVK